MKKMGLLVQAVVLIPLICMGSGGCSGGDESESRLTKGEAAKMAKADSGVDYCEKYGWYKDDVCDDFCLKPDPDCCDADADCEYGQKWCEEGECVPCDNSGLTCKVYCPHGFVVRNGCTPCECAESPGSPQLSSFSVVWKEGCTDSEGIGCYDEGVTLQDSTLVWETAESSDYTGAYRLDVVHNLLCSDVGIVGAQLSVEGNQLILEEDLGEPMDCFCCFEASFRIDGLTAGNYILVIKPAGENREFIRQEIEIPGEGPSDCVEDAGCEYGQEWCEEGECVPCDNSGLTCELYCEHGFVIRNGCTPCECAESPSGPQLSSFSVVMEEECTDSEGIGCYDEGVTLQDSTLVWETAESSDYTGAYRLDVVHNLLCSDVGIVGAQLSVEGNQLILEEDLGEPMDCFCCFEASFRIDGLTAGNYILVIKPAGENREFIRQEIEIPGEGPSDCVEDAGCEYGQEWCEEGECVPCDNSGLTCDLYCEHGFAIRNGCTPCECAD